MLKRAVEVVLCVMTTPQNIAVKVVLYKQVNATVVTAVGNLRDKRPGGRDRKVNYN